MGGRDGEQRAFWIPGLALALAACGCARREPGDALELTRETAIAAPTRDAAFGPCSDVGARRVCWSPSCAGNLCVQARELPASITRRGSEYRCTGRGTERVCTRRAAVAPFQCQGRRCVQEQPRLPDDGEWECSDVAGAVLCRGGAPPAGVATPGVDPGWICGTRRAGRLGERLCLDLDPDLPSDSNGYSCFFENHGARLRRICERSDAPRIGGSCSPQLRCPAGSVCADGLCVPRLVNANCWADLDCGVGECLYGSCSEGPT